MYIDGTTPNANPVVPREREEVVVVTVVREGLLHRLWSIDDDVDRNLLFAFPIKSLSESYEECEERMC